MPYSIFGLPLHPLVVHLTVVLIPVLGIAVVVAALVPRTRRYLRWPVAVAAVLSIFQILITISSGQHLALQSRPSPMIEKHEQLAYGLIPTLLVVAFVSIALLVLTSKRVNFKWINVATWVVAGVAVIAAGTMVVQIVQIGDSGAQSKWHGVGDRPVRTNTGP